MNDSKGKKSFHLDNSLLKKGDSVFFTQSVSPKSKKKAEEPSAMEGSIKPASSRVEDTGIS